MPAWTLDEPRPAPHIRAERIALYTTLLTQYWNWQLEGLKHLVLLNSFGLAALGTLSAWERLRNDFWLPLGFCIFLTGLSFPILSMFSGVERLRAERNAQAEDLDTPTFVHAEMARKNLYKLIWWAGVASLFCFVGGCMLIYWRLP